MLKILKIKSGNFKTGPALNENGFANFLSLQIFKMNLKEILNCTEELKEGTSIYFELTVNDVNNKPVKTHNFEIIYKAPYVFKNETILDFNSNDLKPCVSYKIQLKVSLTKNDFSKKTHITLEHKSGSGKIESIIMEEIEKHSGKISLSWEDHCKTNGKNDFEIKVNDSNKFAEYEKGNVYTLPENGKLDACHLYEIETFPMYGSFFGAPTAIK